MTSGNVHGNISRLLLVKRTQKDDEEAFLQLFQQYEKDEDKVMWIPIEPGGKAICPGVELYDMLVQEVKLVSWKLIDPYMHVGEVAPLRSTEARTIGAGWFNWYGYMRSPDNHI